MAKPYRIAYLSYDGLADPLGQSQILPYILGLEANGFEFTIISFEKPEAYKALRNTIGPIIEGKKIKWIPLKYHKSPPVLSTLLDLFYLWRSVRINHNHHQFDIIHCRSYISSLVGLRMKRKTGVKFIFDMRGFWADERVEGGLWNLKNPVFSLVYNFFKKQEKQFLKEADHVVSLTYNAKAEIESWSINNAPITVIPTCVDLDLFDPIKIKKEDQEALREKLRLKSNDFVLLYLGSWGTWYLTKEMLDFFSELKKKKPEAKFLIVSTDKINLSDYPYKKDVIVSSAQRKTVPLFISLANTSIFFIKTTFSKKASSATKMGEIMAMNVPVITNAGWGDVEQILKNSHLGHCLPDLSHQTFINHLILKENRFQRNSEAASTQFDLRVGIEQYLSIYKDSLFLGKINGI